MVPKEGLDPLNLGDHAIGLGGGARGFRLTDPSTVRRRAVATMEIPGSAVRPGKGLREVGLPRSALITSTVKVTMRTVP